ncbi:hypothetical protein GCM10028832_08420 [Streptomyces sparsus]
MAVAVAMVATVQACRRAHGSAPHRRTGSGLYLPRVPDSARLLDASPSRADPESALTFRPPVDPLLPAQQSVKARPPGLPLTPDPSPHLTSPHLTRSSVPPSAPAPSGPARDG